MKHAIGRVVGLAILAAAVLGAGGRQEERVNPDAKTLAALSERIKAYIDLHQRLESTLPRLSKEEATPQQTDAYQQQLGNLIKMGRRNAKHGDVFTADSRAVIRRLLLQVFNGPDGRQLLAAIMDDNPGPLKIQVNGHYPDNVPLATTPTQVLKGLPPLPEELEYRFLGRRLILLDTHAHLVVDYIDDALPKR